MAYPSREQVSEKVDWLAFTVQFYKELKWADFIKPSWKEISPVARFTNGLENSQGIRIYWNSQRPQMGKHIIMSGSCCTILEDNLKELLQYVLRESFTVTRLDLCVDVRHTNMRPENSTYHLKKRQCKTHAKKGEIVSDALVGGYTQYVGTRNSATYVRIYDKASEMGTDFTWLRIEISYGKRKTKSAIKAYLSNDDIRGMVRQFVDFPRWRKWNAVFNTSKIEVRYEHQTSNTRQWIMGVVVKSIAKEMCLDDGQEFYLSILQRIREEYYGLTRKGDTIDF